MTETETEQETDSEPRKVVRKIQSAVYAAGDPPFLIGMIGPVELYGGRVEHEAVGWILQPDATWLCKSQWRASFADAEAWLLEQLGAVLEEKG